MLKVGKRIFVLLFVVVFSGCSSKSFVFGENKGFCEDCGFQYKGVCANPMDIYYNSDLIMEKKSVCAKKEESKRNGVRE